MMSTKSFLLAIAATASVVNASHSFTVVNKCTSIVTPSITTSAGAGYTGAQPPAIAASATWSTTIANGWEGRFSSGASLAEFTLDAGGLSFYDISNVDGFSIGQSITATGGQTVDCPSATCDCTQAYGVGNGAGTCPGSTVGDQALRITAAANAAFTITYCP